MSYSCGCKASLFPVDFTKKHKQSVKINVQKHISMKNCIKVNECWLRGTKTKSE